MVNPFSGGQSIGGGAYKGTPYDSGTGKPIIRSGGGGGSSKPTPETSVVVRDINNGRGAEVIINGQGYSVLPGQVESFLKARGLSGGSYNQALEIARARDAEFAKEQMRILEAQKQAEAEKRRIEQLAVEIRRQGAQERQKILMNERGERVRQTTTEINKIDKGKSTNALVWKYENLDTGEVRYRSYEGSGRRNIGGVDFQREAPQESGKPVSTIMPYERSRGGVASEFLKLGGVSDSIRRFNNILRTKKERGQITYVEEAKLLAGGFASAIADSLIGIVDLPQTVAYLARNPSEIKRIPAQIQTAGENFGYILRVSPGEAIGYVGGSLVAIKATNSALNSISNAGNRLLTKLNPKFVGSANIGKTLKVKVAPGRSVSVKVVGKIPKQTFAQQINLAGKRVSAISSQADDMFRLLSSKRVVRKPIPGEAKFNLQTKNLLKKFDAGKITRPELVKLEALVKKQGAKGLLERSFFADPSGKIRPSRLGITDSKGAGLLDYLSGDVTFRKAKPQIFLFDDIQIAKFPRNLQGIAKKVKVGRTLSKLEANKLLEWQLKQSGRFKPLGFISGESEITLAPGEILRKVKKIGVTIVQGKKVPIYKVEVFRPTGITRTLLDRLGSGKITNTQKLKLKRLLQRQTGINYASSYTPSARYVNIRYVGYGALGRLSTSISRSGISRGLRSPVSRFSGGSRGLSRISRPISRGSSRSVSRVSRGASGRFSRASSGRSSGSTSRYSGKSYGTSRGRNRSTPKPPVRFRPVQGFRPQQLSRPVQTFYVVEKIRGKFRKLYPKPLVLKDARDYAVYSIDNNLSRTAFFVPLGRAKRVVRPPKNIQNYASRNSFKVRPYRIRFGKRRQLVNGYIEKRRFFQDTSGERNALRVTRKISPQRRRQLIRQLQKARMRRFGNRSPQRNPMRRQVRVRPKRKMSLAQRNVLIARLKRARAVRMRMLRRRR